MIASCGREYVRMWRRRVERVDDRGRDVSESIV